MLGFRPVFLALGACTALLAAPPAAYAAEKNPHYGLQIMKMRPGPAPMTAATAAPGILDYDGIPTVLGTNAANVGGLMYFCYHNKLITDTTVNMLGRELAELPDVRNSSDYAWGGIGMLRLGPDQMFDTRTLNRDQREAVCSRTALMGPDLLKAARNGDAAPGIDNQRASDEKPRWPSEPPPPMRAPVAAAAAVPAGIAATHRVTAPARAVSAPVTHVATPRPAVSAPAYVAPHAVAAPPHVVAPSAPAPQVVSAPPPAVMAPTPAPAPKPVPYTPLPSQQAIQDEVAQKAEAREAAAQAEFARQAASQAGAVR